MSAKDKEHGEGNYKASRSYNDATRKFVESGRVEEAARKAQPESETEALQLKNAETEGRRRAKGEDPTLRSPAKDTQHDPRGKPVTDRSAEETKTPKPGQEGE